jgi:hypothetical protein
MESTDCIKKLEDNKVEYYRMDDMGEFLGTYCRNCHYKNSTGAEMMVAVINCRADSVECTECRQSTRLDSFLR